MKVKPSFNPFQLYNNYYDLLYHDKDYLNEARYISSTIRSILPGAKSILELGSGTGNYSQQFSRLNYEITGVERSEQMISIAEEKGIPCFQSVVADMISFDLHQQYDAAIALFHVMSYLTKNEQVISCLNQVNKHLLPGGLFVFDVWFTPAVYTQLPEIRVKYVENESVHITRMAKPRLNYQSNTVDIGYNLIIQHKKDNQYQSLEEFHCMRHFSTTEIMMFAHLTGFTVIRSEEFLTGNQPGADTWGVCYMLQKNG